MYHDPVLLQECLDGLQIDKDGTYVDATYGGGGHSKEILKRLDTGSLIAFDQDQDALQNKADDERLVLINQNFRYMRNFLKLYKVVPVDGILADLGVSSHQLDVGERGFSVRYQGALDLRMNQRQSLTAAQVVNAYSTHALKTVFQQYGELPNAHRIAQKIETYRSGRPIRSTVDLKEALQSFAPPHQENKFFARVFQALRIEVNDELGALQRFLEQTPALLKPGGRLVVIAYHSLEDRLVKNFMKTGNLEGAVKKDFYGNVETPFTVITRKPIVPGDEEIKKNNRARSARLRIAERTNDK
jgi:16S rRNA (cytosine1402-N4)-methyltransferase